MKPFNCPQTIVILMCKQIRSNLWYDNEHSCVYGSSQSRAEGQSVRNETPKWLVGSETGAWSEDDGQMSQCFW